MTLVNDEIARINATNVSGDLEQEVRKDIIQWLIRSPIDMSRLDMSDVIKQFWNERLN